MKISEYIAELEKVMEEVGDVEVQKDEGFGRRDARKPSVAYALILKGREHKLRFWNKYEGEDRKGGVVCRI